MFCCILFLSHDATFSLRAETSGNGSVSPSTNRSMPSKLYTSGYISQCESVSGCLFFDDFVERHRVTSDGIVFVLAQKREWRARGRRKPTVSYQHFLVRGRGDKSMPKSLPLQRRFSTKFDLVQGFRLGEGWEFQPQNGPHTTAFREPVCLSGRRQFRMRPPQPPSIVAYCPHTVVFEEPTFPPGCRQFSTNGVVAAPRFYVVTYIMHIGETKPCAYALVPS